MNLQDAIQAAKNNGVNETAILAVVCTWPDQATEILPQMRCARDHYFFHRWGMYVGVEYDGYIHT